MGREKGEERRTGRGVSGSDRTRSSGFGWLELGTLAVADLGENRGGEGRGSKNGGFRQHIATELWVEAAREECADGGRSGRRRLNRGAQPSWIGRRGLGKEWIWESVGQAGWRRR